MNDYELVKEKMRCKKRHINFTSKKVTVGNKYVNVLITRLLVALILFLISITLINTNGDVKTFFKDKVLGDNVSFTKISNLYNKYFGNIIPIKNMDSESATVFNEKIKYESIHRYKDGYELTVNDNYLVPIIESGIVVFIGEKEGYGKTIIIQGIDEVDYWYSGITNISSKMYDYVSKGTLLGTTEKNKLYLTFQKKGAFLKYDEVIE